MPQRLAVTVTSYTYDLQDQPDHFHFREEKTKSESQGSELRSFKIEIANTLSIHLLLIEPDHLNTAERDWKKKSLGGQSHPSCNSITMLGGKNGFWCTVGKIHSIFRFLTMKKFHASFQKYLNYFYDTLDIF